ncbi:hypothetical protein [Legionella shakespearei]|uniref:Transmembrane protein n=1 Tax=Legionella shakespearei DSM 23087 TaxID=1122169 RepID=A0A0W0Z893_9GAMM|nr:hypothetical protein [Legionella shakespearei]KTD65332.1 hypothetical protein Lsha_0281 [Legionella shakespearei DSM 23087]
MIFNILLVIHVLCGSSCMVFSIAAIATRKGGNKHRRYGRYFFYGMTGIFITAIPMALIKTNTFLLLIALFSYYLAYTGWRYARRHESLIPVSDWIVCLAMILASFIMISMGLWHFNLSNDDSLILLVFGVLGAIFSLNDALLYYKGTIPRATRISKHLGAMLGGTIAVYTAFLVTNVHYGPPLMLWLSPTVIITPIIIYWTKKVENKKGSFQSK